MKFAYADPPYLGCGRKLYRDLHPEAADYDKIESHKALIDRLASDYDGWAYSLSSTTLKQLLPLCPDNARIGAWVKPFSVFRIGVNPAYAWEPVLFRPCKRKHHRKKPTAKDWVSSVITTRRGTPGAKPDEFCWWIFEILGMQPGDELDDLFPGSGAVGRAWQHWCHAYEGFPLFPAESKAHAEEAVC